MGSAGRLGTHNARRRCAAKTAGRQGPRDARDHHDRAGRVPASDTADARLAWIGPDDRGIELETVAPDLDDAVVVIHVMPTSLRR
jgi:hypothetical protein